MRVCRVRQTSAVDYSKKKQAPLWVETNSEVDYSAVKAALEMEAKLEADAIANAKAKHEAKLKVEQEKMNGIGTATGVNFRPETTSYMHSRFKNFSDLARKDKKTEDPLQIPVHQLWRSVEAIICHYEGASVASRFVEGLQDNVADYCEKHYIDEDDVQVMSMLIWSNMAFGGAKREFCSLLNAALREDYPDTVVQHAVVFSRALSSNLVMHLVEATTRGPLLADATNYKDWPNGPKVPKHLGKSSNKDTTWRGGGMPKKDFDWWLELDKQTSGPKKCRTKMFVASSFTRGVAEDFAARYYDASNPDGSGRVLFRFKFERHRCLHVNYIDRSRYPEEKEFLLPPYTVLELEGVQESLDLDAKPHVITVKVAYDNQAESLDLPLIPRI